MSILGAVARLRPQHLAEVLPRLQALPGVDVALNPGDGRLVLVLEDSVQGSTVHAATDTLTALSQWPEMMSVTLVYEYSGPDAPALAEPRTMDYRSWRGDQQADPHASAHAHP